MTFNSEANQTTGANTPAGGDMGAIEPVFQDEKRLSGQHSRYRMFDEFNEYDQTKLFQALGFLGFFRRAGLSHLSFESASVLLMVAQRQSEGKTTTYQHWQKLLGLKTEAAAQVCEQLGLPFKEKTRSKKAAVLPEQPTELGLFYVRGDGCEESEIALTVEGKKAVEDMMRCAVFGS